MLDRLRGRLETYLEAVGKWFAGLEPSPTVWTFLGLAVSGLAGLSYSTTGYGGQLLGGVLILVAGWFDIVDGAVAKATARASKRGAFLDSTLDRLAEVVVFLGILVGGAGGASASAVLLALAFSLLVSYTRAKGDALGTTLSGIGIGERSERLLILAVASIVGQVGWGVILVGIVAAYTFAERTFRASRNLGETDKAIHTDVPQAQMITAS